jgi:hypothetical protein
VSVSWITLQEHTSGLESVIAADPHVVVMIVMAMVSAELDHCGSLMRKQMPNATEFI